MRFGIKITPDLRMEEEPLAAEGVYASAVAELPTSSTTTKTAALSAADGSSSGLPAGFTAQPEVQPLRSGEAVPPLRQVQNINSDASGTKQEHLLAAQDLALAAEAELQSPENHYLLESGEEISEAGEHSTASSPRATDDNGEPPPRSAMAASPFTPSGSQSTHGSSVGVNTPSLLSLLGATPDSQSGCESNPRQGPASSAPGSRLASRVRATVRHLQARADALRSPGMSPGGLGQLQGAPPGLPRPSYLPPTPSELGLDVTNVQPHSEVGAGPPSGSPMMSNSPESYNPSSSAPGHQGRKGDPPPIPAIGIRRRNEIPLAKALAAVVSLPFNNPQGKPLITTDNQSETVARPWEESPTPSPSAIGIQPREERFKSVVPPTSPSVIGIQLGESNPSSVVSPISQITLGIQREVVTPSGQLSTGIQVKLPSIPSLPLPELSAADLPLDGSAPPLPRLPLPAQSPPPATAPHPATPSDPALTLTASRVPPGAPTGRSYPLSPPSPQQPLLPQSPQAPSSPPPAIPPTPPATLLPPTAPPGAVRPPAASELTPGGSPPHSDPLPSPLRQLTLLTMWGKQRLPSPPLPMPPPSPPSAQLAPPAAPSPSAVLLTDATPSSAATGLTLGDSVGRSDPLLPFPPLQPLPPALPLQLSLPPPPLPPPVSPPPPATPLPSATSPADATSPPAAAMHSGPASPSDLPPSSLPPQPSPSPPHSSPSSSAPLPPPATTSPPAASPPDAALPPAAAAPTRDDPVGCSDPLPSLPLHPQPSCSPPRPPSPLPFSPPSAPLPPPATTSPPAASPPDAALPPAAAAPTRDDPVGCSDPLPSLPLHPQPSFPPPRSSLPLPFSPPSAPLPPPATTSPPAASPPDAALPPAAAAPTRDDPVGCSDPLPSLPLHPQPSFPPPRSSLPLPFPPPSAPLPPPATTLPPAASPPDAALPPAAAALTRDDPVGRSDPPPSSLPSHPPPSSLLPPSPLPPPLSPDTLPLPPTLSSPPAASPCDAAPLSAAAKLTLGGPDSHSDHLPSSQPPQAARSPPQLPPSQSLSPPIAPPLPHVPPLPSAVSSPDAGPPPTTALVTLGDQDAHSDPLPSSPPLQHLVPPLQPPLPSYALPLPAPPRASPTTPPPAAVPPPSPIVRLSPDPAHTLPTVAVYSLVVQEPPSDPLLPPQPLQPQTAQLQPPPSLQPSSSTTPLPSATPLSPDASPVAPPLPTTLARTPSGPVAAKDPLGGPVLSAELAWPTRVPVDTEEGSEEVTNLHPASAPASPATAPPTAAATDVARSLPAVILAPGGLGERSEPLPPLSNPFSRDKSLVSVTNTHPASTAVLTSAAAPPAAAAADAALLLSAIALAPGDLAGRSHPLLPPPIPLTQDAGMGGVTNIHPHSTAGLGPAALTAAPPPDAAADAARLLPASALAPGGLAGRSHPLLSSPTPLTHAEMGGVTNVHPHSTAGLVPVELTAAPPLDAAADAARLLPAIALAPGGLTGCSHPLLSPPTPLTQDAEMGGVTNVHPHLTTGPVPAALTAAPPPAAASDAARLLPPVAIAPGGLAGRSHPLLSPPTPLTQDAEMGGVTNVHPHLTTGPVPAALTAAPPPAAASDAARLLPPVANAPGGLAGRSHPLLSPPTPLTQDAEMGGVTNVHPHLTTGPVPAALTAAPPPAAASDAARLLPPVANAPGGLPGRSHPLLSPPIPLTQDAGMGGVTNVHLPSTAGPAPAAPTAATLLTAVDDAARLLPSVALASVSPYESSHPLPQFPLPRSAPPSTGDGWKCLCRPQQNWHDRRRCEDCGRLWCAACTASQCMCEPEFFRLRESDATPTQPRDHPACVVGPSPPPPVPDAPEDPSLAENVAGLPAIAISPLSRPINGGMVQVRNSLILPENASARTNRGCTSAPVAQGGEGGHATVRDHTQRADARDDDEKRPAFSQSRVDLSEPPGGRPDLSAQTKTKTASLDVTYVHGPPSGTPPASPPSSPPGSPVDTPEDLLARSGGTSGILLSDRVLPESMSELPPPPSSTPTPLEIWRGAAYGHPPANASRPAGGSLFGPPVAPPGVSLFGPPAASAGISIFRPPADPVVPGAPAASPSAAPSELPDRPRRSSRPAGGSLFEPPVAPPGVSLFGPPAASAGISIFRPPSDPVVPGAPAASPSAATSELPDRPRRSFGPPPRAAPQAEPAGARPDNVSPTAPAGLDALPPSEALYRSESLVGVANVHPQDVPPAPRADPASASSELPDRPRRSFGPPPRAAPQAEPAGARPDNVSPTAPAGLDALPPSEALYRSESLVGVTNVHPQDVPPAPRADPAVTAASTSQLPSARYRLGDQKGHLELPEKPRRSFGPPLRAAPQSEPAGDRPDNVSSTAPAGLAVIPATTPDDLLEVLASNKRASQAELPTKPTREQPTQSSLPDAEALQLAAQKKESARLAKNARARAKAATERAAAEKPDAMEGVTEEPRELTQHLLGEFDKASITAEVESTFTKQVAGIPAAIRTKVASGRVSLPPTEASSPHDSAGDDETSDGLSEVGGETFEPYEPTVGDYVQIKMTSASSFKGLVMQIHRVKGTLCTLRQIGAANVPGAKRPAVDSKSLHDIQRTGVTDDIHRNPANLQDYVNLRVENPTLPEAPPPIEPETSRRRRYPLPPPPWCQRLSNCSSIPGWAGRRTSAPPLKSRRRCL